MGFRSVFVTADDGEDWPQWFRDKWEQWAHFGRGGTLSSRLEAKVYHTWQDLPTDLQRAIDWSRRQDIPLVLVYLHECGGVTRVEVTQDAIHYMEPLTWASTDHMSNGVAHDYCYGCTKWEDAR